MERLDKFLAQAGCGTRSQVKLLLRSGRVTVDGQVCTDGARKVDDRESRICLDGEAVGAASRALWMMNKPAGYVTATEDPVEKTVMELLPENLRRTLRPVGRLDKATEGLLLFTDDGDLLHRLISPKNHVSKLYYARHEGTAREEDVAAFRQGITLRDGTVCRSALLEPLGPGESMITLWEGKYHQVRRMMASRGMTVTYLERRREGCLELGDLPRGQIRPLLPEEAAALEAEAAFGQNTQESALKIDTLKKSL